MPKGVPRDSSVNHAIIHRLRIVQGHLSRVLEMVKQDKYCIDIINQSKAIQSALKNTDSLILKNHLETCVVSEIKKGNTKNVVKEVIQIMDNTKNSDHSCCCKPCTCKNCTCTCDKDEKKPCTCKCKDCKCQEK